MACLGALAAIGSLSAARRNFKPAAIGVLPMANKAYLLPIYRAAWADMLAGDARLSHIAVRVGIVIGGFFNSGSAETFVAQPTIAKHMGISERTIWEAVRELTKLGHLISQRGHGRRSNTYGMPVERVAKYCQIYSSKSRSGLRYYGDQSRSGLRDESGFVPQNCVSSPAIDCEQTLLPSEVINSTVPNNVSRLNPHGDKWQAVYVRLMQTLGADVASNWFADLSIIRIADGECHMEAPNKFIANYIPNNFYPALAAAWQYEDEAVKRITIVARSKTRQQQHEAPIERAPPLANGGAS